MFSHFNLSLLLFLPKQFRFLLNKTIDVLLYVDRLDAYRVDNLDKQVIKAITDTFGKRIWQRSLVVLTHAQLSPPDGLSYDEFFTRRSETLLKCIRFGARIKKQEFEVYAYFLYVLKSFLFSLVTTTVCLCYIDKFTELSIQ